MPAPVATIISPEASPFSSGNSITNDLPNSSTVVVKSVPLITICAVGVVILIRSLLISPIFEVINRAVPDAKRKLNFDLSGSGLKIYSVITSFECSVSLTTESSTKVIPTLPDAVLTSSIC